MSDCPHFFLCPALDSTSQPNCICSFTCQSRLNPPLRVQGAWEVQSTLCISNTELVHHRTELHQHPGGSPGCWSRAWQSRVGDQGTGWSRAESRMQTFGTRGRGEVYRRCMERCPLTTTGHRPRCGPCSPSEPQEQQLGWKQPFRPVLRLKGRWGGRQGGLGKTPTPPSQDVKVLHKQFEARTQNPS